jgi:hypothetical protein
MSGGEVYDLSTDLSTMRTSPQQRRGAGVVAADWCLRKAGLERGEPLGDLPPQLREMAATDLREILDASHCSSGLAWARSWSSQCERAEGGEPRG